MIVIKEMESDAEIKGKAYVHWKSWHDAYKGIVDPDYLDSLTLKKYEEIAFKWPGNTLIAKDGDRVIGFLSNGKCRDEQLADTGEIFAIYILEEYYRTGVGDALIREGLNKLDYPQTVLWVLDENRRAIRFYEKHGFYRDGFKKDINLGSILTEIRMIRRELNSQQIKQI